MICKLKKIGLKVDNMTRRTLYRLGSVLIIFFLCVCLSGGRGQKHDFFETPLVFIRSLHLWFLKARNEQNYVQYFFLF